MRQPVLVFCAVVAQEADSSRRQKTGETVNVGRRAGYFTSQLSDGAIALLKTVTYDEIVASRNAKFMKICARACNDYMWGAWLVARAELAPKQKPDYTHAMHG